MIEESSCFFSR